MSYINFQFTVQPAAGALPPAAASTLDVGFSREGGRLDYIARSGAAGAAPAVEVPHAPAVVSAAAGLKDALLGAGFPASVTIERGDGSRPDLVSWTGMRGAGGGSALAGALPAPIANVVTAAGALDAVAAAELASGPAA